MISVSETYIQIYERNDGEQAELTKPAEVNPTTAEVVTTQPKVEPKVRPGKVIEMGPSQTGGEVVIQDENEGQ